METLFEQMAADARRGVAPLAVRKRPQSLEELVGQDEAIGPTTWLRGAIEQDSLSSIILFGPAGTGKTTLARLIASRTDAHFSEVSAVSSGVGDLRRVIDEATRRLTLNSQRTILFIDEIHRFSRSQQDALLHAVEDRLLILVGATTENPYFEVNSALNSRSRVIEFKPLTDADILAVLRRALAEERGLGGGFIATGAALSMIAASSGGDARAALNSLELASEVAHADGELSAAEKAELAQDGALPKGGNLGKPGRTAVEGGGNEEQGGQIRFITSAAVAEATPRSVLPYDKKGDTHYDVISAFIKSMRGSDPDAAIYWLARMIDGGEDPKFIARRIFIFASEDIGNADPQALLVANAAFRSAEVIGYPECRINLAQAAIYMALAPKSNSAICAIDAALADVRQGPLRAVPSHLRDRHRPGSDSYGKYHYPHLDARGWTEQGYLPEGLARGAFYTAGPRGWEAYRAEAVKSDRPQGDGA
jgi:putative ATPase